MAITFHLDIVSAEEEIFAGAVEYLSIRGQDGEMGIYFGHAPLLTGILPGEIVIKKPNGKNKVFYVSGGMLEVQPEVVTILADTVERAEDIDEAQAREAKEKALENYEAKKKSKADYEKAFIELQEASARLKAVKELNKYVKDSAYGQQ